MSKNKWVRTISFNRSNPNDQARLKLIGKKSFSRYIKHLLDEEIKRQNANSANTNYSEIPKSTSNTTQTQSQQRVIPTANTTPVIPQPKPKVFTNPMLKGK